VRWARSSTHQVGSERTPHDARHAAHIGNRDLGPTAVVQLSAERHLTMLDGDRYIARRDPERAKKDVLSDLTPDLLIGAMEGANEIGSGDDPGQIAVDDHRQAVHPTLDHQPCCFRDRPTRLDRDRR